MFITLLSDDPLCATVLAAVCVTYTRRTAWRRRPSATRVVQFSEKLIATIMPCAAMAPPVYV